MKIKLTPLNIVSALSIVGVFALLFNKSWLLSPANEAFKGLFIALFLLVLFMSFLGDQIFRKFIPSLAKLWLMQLLIIALTVVLILVLKLSILS